MPPDPLVATITHNTIVALSVLGVVGQVLVAVMLLIGLLALVGLRGPLNGLRRLLWGYELWSGFVVAAIATGGSLFFSEIAPFIPCELCWFQRICMYPLSYLLLVLAWRGDNRFARYLLVFPVFGAGVSIYHIMIERNVIHEPPACVIGGRIGCSTKWINEFGYITIPTLALTAFLLLIGFLVLAGTGVAEETATLRADAER
jgi:disulfide bond formation protein DsbB